MTDYALPPEPFSAPDISIPAAPSAAPPMATFALLPQLPAASSLPMGLGVSAPMLAAPVRPRAFGNPDIRNNGHMLGMSTLVVGVSALVGARFGGFYGGIAGSLFGGSAVNAYRAISHATAGTPQSDREALISGTYTILAAGLAGFILYQSQKTGMATRNPEPHSCGQARENGRRSCGIRPVI